ncbi:hypothetical protein TNCV_855761 [Trichonephila clavipes]|nr:hypothetical protein TNCV_855761 [Trichonephila clavipes]
MKSTIISGLRDHKAGHRWIMTSPFVIHVTQLPLWAKKPCSSYAFTSVLSDSRPSQNANQSVSDFGLKIVSDVVEKLRAFNSDKLQVNAYKSPGFRAYMYKSWKCSEFRKIVRRDWLVRRLFLTPLFLMFLDISRKCSGRGICRLK